VREVQQILITKICSTAEGVDVRQLLDFWTQHCSEWLVWGDGSQKPQEPLIEQALDIGTQDAVRLAAFLASNSGPPRSNLISPQLAERVVCSLCSSIETSNGDERLLNVQLLLQQTPNTYELSTWRNPEIIDVIRGQHWLLDRLAERLRDMVNSKYRFDPEQLRKGLGVFVEKRSEFPVEIPLAAMEALLRADEIVATPLSDSDWQIANN
jgi:hypothetical protein